MRLMGDAVRRAGLPKGAGTSWRLRVCVPLCRGMLCVSGFGASDALVLRGDGARAAAWGWQPPVGAAGARRGADTGV